MLTLPLPPRRARLQAFAAVLAAVAGGGLAVAAVVLRLPWFPLTPGVAVALAAFGWARPQAFTPLYLAWNRLGSTYSRVLRLALKLLVLFVVVAAGKPAGSPLRLAPPGGHGSLWSPRPGAGETRTEECRARGLPATYLAWATNGGRWWALALLPFLLLLGAVDTEIEPTLPTQTYTLF